MIKYQTARRNAIRPDHLNMIQTSQKSHLHTQETVSSQESTKAHPFRKSATRKIVSLGPVNAEFPCK